MNKLYYLMNRNAFIKEKLEHTVGGYASPFLKEINS